jgi:hypothetical protein
MMRFGRHLTRTTAAAALVLAFAGCESSDVIAPEGSEISLTANPATIVLSMGVQASPVTIIATVYNSIGIPLPGQDVRFETTNGELSPAPGTPVETDGAGVATAELTNVRQAPMITARSGKATETLTLQTATCNLASITLSPSQLDVDTCNDEFTLTAVAVDTMGAPCVGILIAFENAGTMPMTDITGTSSPASDTTDTSGEATTTFSINSTECNAKCVGGGCTGGVRAGSGSVTSSVVPINDNVS